ncbi:MAG TPA: B12-binding domain-containing protein, partial [Clostridiales bacterium]|nr:B12-binding domain-containing protein [Clostridiales bacterium]
MEILSAISENLQKGKANTVRELVREALDKGFPAEKVLEEGLISGMDVIGTKFMNNEIYVPEV